MLKTLRTFVVSLFSSMTSPSNTTMLFRRERVYLSGIESQIRGMHKKRRGQKRKPNNYDMECNQRDMHNNGYTQ